jgi:hypothetical protein
MTQNDIKKLLIEAALPELREIKRFANEVAMSETPIDEGDLLQSIRIDDKPKQDLGFELSWGEEQGPNKFVDYADAVTLKGSKGETLNAYYDTLAEIIAAQYGGVPIITKI